jgi:methylenetetrahydrofolate reductase (NADPH)
MMCAREVQACLVQVDHRGRMRIAFWRRRRSPGLSEEQRTALKTLVADAKFELIPLKDALERSSELPPGSAVTVTASPSHGIEATFELCEGLMARGHSVEPHLSAHMVRDRSHLADLLDRARVSGMDRAFVVGGDAKQKGEFHDGVALLHAMDELGHPFEAIGVPAYPEGHVDIPQDRLLSALKEKQRYAAFMTTQMCFDPSAIRRWIHVMRAEGVTLAIHLGTPGVAEITRLMTIAARIGVADSARYLKKNRSIIGHLIAGSFGPDALLEALAPTLIDPAADVRALHLFTFNQVHSTADWQRDMLAELGA